MDGRVIWEKVQAERRRDPSHTLRRIREKAEVTRQTLYNYRDGGQVDIRVVDDLSRYFGWDPKEVWAELAASEGSPSARETPLDAPEFSRRTLLKGTLAAAAGGLPGRQPGSRQRQRLGQRQKAQGDAVPARSHEQRAEELNRKQQWAPAAVRWSLAADEAERSDDWRRWAQCVTAVGQMGINLGQLTHAERCFNAVLARPARNLTAAAVAEANVRLGWLYVDQEQYAKADGYLTRGLALSRARRSSADGEYRLLENGTTLVGDERETLVALENTALHFLGKTHIARGQLKKGIDEFETCGAYAKDTKQHWALACRILEQIPARMLLRNQDAKAIKAMIDEAKGEFGKIQPGEAPSGQGIISLAEARWRRAMGIGDPMSALEDARHVFTGEAFYARGLADVNREASGLSISQDRGQRDALRYALAAVAECPYPSSLKSLQDAVQAVYSDIDVGFDATKFWNVWGKIEEELLQMQQPPFAELDDLVQAFGYVAGKRHLETGLTAARRCAASVVRP